ncbi:MULTISPECIES: Rieske (2Fe-2S) protein [unclassified Mycobacterium]|uniref:QcrA and Rieske domain-containing protein n=1 Tax=unclassified Mycobacterium TaxID=2642494 RepID=UPI000490F06B|nr:MULTISPECIES: Rieske (2Fe-2S) protein [unclassified Mycobacterium]SEA23877.1 Rieske [2Fe-2S] domain-containing protein [Mycobacterium sp. 283mftsu]
MAADKLGRREVLAGTGIALGATVIAGCQTYGKPPAAASQTPATTPGGGTTPTADSGLVKTSAVPVGSGVIVGEVVVTQPTAGEFKGMSAICTHQGCTVSEVVDGTIKCPCHGSKFNLDGTVAQGPAKKPLEAKAVKVQGDSIVLG